MRDAMETRIKRHVFPKLSEFSQIFMNVSIAQQKFYFLWKTLQQKMIRIKNLFYLSNKMYILFACIIITPTASASSVSIEL